MTFAATNLAATDQMIDTPQNSTGGNFATWNPLCYSPNTTFKEGNLKHVGTSASNSGNTPCTFTPPAAGKWYWEEHCSNINSTQWPFIGTVDATVYEKVGTWSDNNGRPGESESNGGWKISADGEYETDGGGTTNGGVSFNDTTDIIQFALDHDNGALYYGKNNVWYTPTATTGVGSGVVVPVVIGYGSGSGISTFVLNFGQDSSFAGQKTAQGNMDSNDNGDFYYAPPAGYLAPCTNNLTDPAIALPGEYFNSVLYTGNSTGGRDITVGMAPDLVWCKNLTGNSHSLNDSVRGVNKQLASNSTANQTTHTNRITAFNSDGFTTGDSDDTNANNDSIISWNWKAGGAPTVDNSAGAGNTPTAGSVKINGSNLGSALAGTIPAVRLSANTESGFSIVRYAGTGVNGTVAHGLSKAPELVIAKPKTNSTDAWRVGSDRLASWVKELRLNTTAAQTDRAAVFNSLAPTASVINLGTDGANNGGGVTFVAYSFHSVEGYSKVGSYEGNSNVDGTFVYTGFRPAFVLAKNLASGKPWIMYDDKRDTYNEMYKRLLANDNAAANTSEGRLDFVSNGIKWRIGDSHHNDGTFIYIAFAESPFKYARAR